MALEIWMLLSVGIGIIIALLAIVLVWRIKKGKYQYQTDYKGMFWMGIIFTLFGALYIFFVDNAFTGIFVIGLVFIGVGSANKDKWGKRKKPDPKTQKWLMIATLIGIIVLVIGVATLFLLR